MSEKNICIKNGRKWKCANVVEEKWNENSKKGQKIKISENNYQKD